jgi:hypothetical protein
MKQSRQAEEMMELMDIAEKFVGESKIDKDDVKEAAYETAEEVFGDEMDKKKVNSMIKSAIDQAESTEEAIEIVQNMMRKNEAKQMGYSGQAIETSGPGAKKRNTRNDYTREEVSKMLDYAKQFVNNKKKIESWKYGQDWLNNVGDAMKEFIQIDPGNPEYEEGEMQGDHHSKPYSKTSYGNAAKGKVDQDMKGKSPGPQRGKKMDKDYDINQRRSTKRKTRTDYNK